jgi:hypothetical protein
MDPVEYIICRANALASSPDGERIRNETNANTTKEVVKKILQWGGECAPGLYGMTVCHVPPVLSEFFNGTGGATFGSVYGSTQPLAALKDNEPLIYHESRHAYQWAAETNAAFATLYLAEEARSKVQYAAWLTGGGRPFVSEARCFNRFEQAANLTSGGYEC